MVYNSLALGVKQEVYWFIFFKNCLSTKENQKNCLAFEALICCIPIILKGLSQMKSANMFWWFPPRKPELGELLLCMCYGIDRLLSLSERFFQIWTPENYW